MSSLDPPPLAESLRAALRRLWKICNVLTIALLLFLALEFVSRWIIPLHRGLETDATVEASRTPKPYVMFGGKPGGTVTYISDAVKDQHTDVLNDRGYRGAAPILPKPQGEFRIAVTGGSAVFNGNPTIPESLERILAERQCPFVQVYNFGVLSQNSSQELVQTIFEIVDTDPDLILQYDGGNDVLATHYDPRPGYPFLFLLMERSPLLVRDIRSYPFFSLLAYGSHVLRLVYRPGFEATFASVEDLKREVGYNTLPWMDRIASIYVQNSRKLQTISRSFDVRALTVLQPLSMKKEHLFNTETLEPKSFAEEQFYFFHRAVEEKATRLQVTDPSFRFATLARLLSNREELFVDFIHTNQEGMDLIAGVLADSLEQNFGPCSTWIAPTVPAESR